MLIRRAAAAIAALAPLAALALVVPAASATAARPGAQVSQVLRVGAQPAGDATATVETDPVLESGDAADDPAIWVHPTDPSRSLVIGSDNAGALEVYDLAGRRLQRIAEGNFGNVDLRQGVPTGTGPKDLVVVHRAGIRVYAVDPMSRHIANVTDADAGSIPIGFTGDGLCLYRSAANGALYAFVDAANGRVAQYELLDGDGDGLIEGRLRRSWDVGTAVEGCVADDDTGALYISEEDVAIWRYGAEPSAATGTSARTAVDTTVAAGGHIRPDAEGLTLVDLPGGDGYLIASSQAGSDTGSSFLVYDRRTNAYVRSFRVAGGAATDGCNRTDGVAAVAADLGPAFPRGLFVCQDGRNTAPGVGNQDFKLVPLERVVGLDEAPPVTPISVVGAANASANASRHRVVVPAGVAAGDTLLLLLAVGTLADITTPPGGGWVQLDAVTASSSRTVVWRKVATGADAGVTVQVGLATSAKASLTIVGYRGVRADAPIAGWARRIDTGSSHATPPVSVTTPGAFVVSWWAHKDATTTALVAPSGVVARASGTQSGAGRVTTLLADATASSAGTAGGAVATAAATGSGHAWSIVLAPG